MGSIGYKLFKVKKSCPGQLFPLYVFSNEPIPIGEWIDAKCGEMENGKVKSKLGPLKYRPGWHINDAAPYVSHIGIKCEGKIMYMHPDTVWAEVEYSDSIDYSLKVRENGTINGKYIPKKTCLDVIPVNGFYRYKTSPSMTGEWIIAGSMKIKRILTDEEVEKRCKTAGYQALPRIIPFSYEKYGLIV